MYWHMEVFWNKQDRICKCASEEELGLKYNNGGNRVMTKKYLAYISPEEDITGKEYAYCRVSFITGDLDHHNFQRVWLKTDIFRYY